MAQPDLIARRKLQFTSRDNASLRACSVGITPPREVVHGQDTDDALHDPLAVCEIVFEGLEAPPIAVHGADSLQALAAACEIDPYLRTLERQHGFEFFWDDGSPYFAPGK
jgi:hypothetical protein